MAKITVEVKRGTRSNYYTLQGSPARKMIKRMSNGELTMFNEDRDIFIKEIVLV